MADEKPTPQADAGKDVAPTAPAASTSAAPEQAAAAGKPAAKISKRGKKKLQSTQGIAHVLASFNNTIITITDMSGNAICWASSGSSGYHGSKKSTPYAAQKTMEDTINRLKETGLSEVDVFVKGIGTGRESAVRALQGSGLSILSIQDQTPIPHGGVRPKKARRV